MATANPKLPITLQRFYTDTNPETVEGVWQPTALENDCEVIEIHFKNGKCDVWALELNPHSINPAYPRHWILKEVAQLYDVNPEPQPLRIAQ
jgi:hypothetical protein